MSDTMQMRNFWLIAAVLPLTSMSGCAALGGNGQTGERLDRIEERLDYIEERVESDSLLDLAAELDEAREELRSMRGDVETLQHEMEGSRDRQREIYLDLDRRLQGLEAGGMPAAPIDDDEGVLPPPGRDDPEDVTDEPEETDEDARDAYDAAFSLLRDGRYDEAATAFSDFMDSHADSELAPNALYWLGEVHYVTRDFETALEKFRGVVDEYSDSNKVPDAKLKIGFSHYELEDWDEAREVLRAVRDDYPDTSAASLAGNRLNRMEEAGR